MTRAHEDALTMARKPARRGHPKASGTSAHTARGPTGSSDGAGEWAAPDLRQVRADAGLRPSVRKAPASAAVAQGLKVKVYDLLLEALEEWGEKRGLVGPW